MARPPAFWSREGGPGALLAPLGALVAVAANARRNAFARGWRASVALPVPVLVVGNIFIGGTGKTPLTLWLAQALRERGRRPGIVLRGYGGKSRHWPLSVATDSDPTLVGDEAVLLARRGACPVAAAPDRVAAARLLLERTDCDCILSDDGLQHYRLRRDAEIAVIDAARGLGNGRCFPAGPLREPPSRLRSVDLVLYNGGSDAQPSFSLRPQPLRRLRDDHDAGAAVFSERRVHAVAGIGNPDRFFAALRAQGLDPIEHPFPDHHAYSASELDFGDGLPVIMTEKDAVKAQAFERLDLYYQPVLAQPNASARVALDALLDRLLEGRHV